MDYIEFRQQYEERHPASVPVHKDELEEYPSWLQPLCLLMFIAVSIVSGVHTVSTVRYTMAASLVIPEPLKDIASLAAFFGFELALFVSVYSWLRNHVRWLPYVSTFVVFVLIVLTNVQDIAQAARIDGIGAVIVGGIGIGTPLVALLSGKMFVDIYRSKRGAAHRADEQYDVARVEWDKEIARAWGKYLKSIDEREQKEHDESQKLEALQSQINAINASNNVKNNMINKREKPSPRLEKALRWLEENPNHLETPPRQLEGEIGVSYGTIFNAQQFIKNNQNGHSQNGHKEQ